jgi:uncharacterized protein (DUF1330 family)
MAGPQELNEALLRSLPETGPVVMVNLVRMREHVAEGWGSGWDAYLAYSRDAMRLIKARGGTVLWAGRPEAVAFGMPDANRWDYIVLVQYPSRAAFLSMVDSAEYKEANAQREAGVEQHVIIAATETYSRLNPKR